MNICSFLIDFWIYHPALLYGTSFLLGIYGHYYFSLILLVPYSFFWLPFFGAQVKQGVFKHLALTFLISISGWFYASTYSPFLNIPQEGITGNAHVHITNIQLKKGMFGDKWVYKCIIRNWNSESFFVKTPFQCSISLPKKKSGSSIRPLANKDYWVYGRLVANKYGYQLKVSAKSLWTPLEGSHSIAETRYQWKKSLAKWIKKQFLHSVSGSFIAGLITGEFDESRIRHEFSRFGLQHILAISGFHFAIIAGFLSLSLPLILPRNLAITFLLAFLSLYCFFLGPQPSILRAWMMCSLTLLGNLIHKQSTALNSMGIALILILLYDPSFSTGIPFQLSFGVTLCILLFYSPAQEIINQFIPKRTLIQLINMNKWNQHVYCMLSFLRSGLALTFAVNLIAFPLTLFYFKEYPVNSILYNLFFPYLISGSLYLLILGGIFIIVPFISEQIHTLNSYYTHFVLGLTSQISHDRDLYLSIDSFPADWLIFYLSCLIAWGMVAVGKSYSRNGEKTPNSG